jgi:hypothetical protein
MSTSSFMFINHCRRHRPRALPAVTVAEVEAVKKCDVFPVCGKEPQTIGSLISSSTKHLTLLIFFTHWCVALNPSDKLAREHTKHT